MKERFLRHLKTAFPDLADKKLLLAVSGGIDSMVMTDLFRNSGFNIALAHCNFNLRGAESDWDEEFIKSYARRHNLPVYVTHFDTSLFAVDNKLSVQLAARQLRYIWFNELLEQHRFDLILTAHHADDSLETFIINLRRGTGLDGLLGIPQQNGNIIRPLLPFSREEIQLYAESHGISWREDSSNDSDKYLRNRIRKEVIPQLKSISSNFLSSFLSTAGHLRQSHSMVEDASALVFKEVAIEKEHKIIFKIFDLKRLPNYQAYLYHWLRDFGFTAWDDIYALCDAQSGKKIFSGGHMLLKDREILILTKIPSDEKPRFDVALNDNDDLPIRLSIDEVDQIADSFNDCIFVDADKIEFPMTLRRWEESDIFYPFGMTGKKLVSKFFKDEKVPLDEKASSWILTSAGDIVWIIGRRADNRFRVTSDTKKILKITII